MVEKFETGHDRDSDELAELLREAADSIESGGCQRLVVHEDVTADDHTEKALFVKYIPTL